ncbi:hypothetical protein F383_39024 [Gossypium arboreum]|uniref:Uncharacterized protein n=1 Tax=Gossypium arboreum TaxID=29729 RepID=A0A0B0MEW3_GOSAR|nr:hypothetical protein F383_39024 [Gossypium arboreum]
MSQSVSLE